MIKISRRSVTKGFAGLWATGLLPNVAFTKSSGKVVIIGGGAGGATVARYLKKDAPELDVTLVEMQKTYTTCFFSNWYVGGFRTMEQITHSYSKLINDYGVNVIHAKATDVDTTARNVTLEDGTILGYDKLVLSPGIDFRFDAIEGYDEEVAEKLPHAYKAGPQTKLLHDQVRAIPQGGTFMMIAPPNPYRCPPGPYERISLIAYYLSQNNPTAKITILDPKPKFSKQALFEEAWDKYYGGMIEWINQDFTDGAIVRVDAATMEAETAAGDVYSADAINVIPPQKAGIIAERAGVTNETGWCPVIPETFASTMAEHVFVLGDSSIASAMPKSGFSANSQAKNVAAAIRAMLVGSKKFPSRFNNTCWSLLTPEDTIKVGASYTAGETAVEKVSGFISQTGEESATRKAATDEAIAWYAAITSDMFG